MPTKIRHGEHIGKCGCGERAFFNHTGSPCCQSCYDKDAERYTTRKDTSGLARAVAHEKAVGKELGRRAEAWLEKRGLKTYSLGDLIDRDFAGREKE
jgi:hypothetical protein